MAQRLVTTEFDLGQVVYVKTDAEQDPCIVTAICIRPGHVTYQISRSEWTQGFYDFELSATKNVHV